MFSKKFRTFWGVPSPSVRFLIRSVFKFSDYVDSIGYGPLVETFMIKERVPNIRARWQLRSGKILTNFSPLKPWKWKTKSYTKHRIRKQKSNWKKTSEFYGITIANYISIEELANEIDLKSLRYDQLIASTTTNSFTHWNVPKVPSSHAFSYSDSLCWLLT